MQNPCQQLHYKLDNTPQQISADQEHNMIRKQTQSYLALYKSIDFRLL